MQYSDARHLLILADCGGSNGYRARLWKYQIQIALCERFGLHVSVFHFPPGSSKWNPIEHCMFCFHKQKLGSPAPRRLHYHPEFDPLHANENGPAMRLVR